MELQKTLNWSGMPPEAACCPARSKDVTPSWLTSASWGARSQGSFQATVKDIVGGENHTVGIQQSHAESNGKTLVLGLSSGMA